jgi:phosphatidylethanolamine-binding protein
VIDVFDPMVDISISWDIKHTADFGNTLHPSDLQDVPEAQLTSRSSGSSAPSNDEQLTLALTDPDAPGRDTPKWSEFCHWIITNVPLNAPKDESSPVVSGRKIRDVMLYYPPGPPPKTGKHRYVFLALAPKNGTTQELELSQPRDRRHWGYQAGKGRVGLRRWVEENGLEVVGPYPCKLDPAVDVC